MAGPIVISAPGKSSLTAAAMTWAVLWRRISTPSGSAGRTHSTFAPSGSGRARSITTPSTLAAMATFAFPSFLASSRSVIPAQTPSGFPLDVLALGRHDEGLAAVGEDALLIALAIF